MLWEGTTVLVRTRGIRNQLLEHIDIFLEQLHPLRFFLPRGQIVQGDFH